MGFAVLEIQPTPNPNALKFVVDRPIASQPESFFSAEAAASHILASKLFEVSGVASILILGDFVTVNKRPAARWSAITARVKEILQNAS
jgi:hypothetical protein